MTVNADYKRDNIFHLTISLEDKKVMAVNETIFFQSCLVSMKLPLECIVRESATHEAGKIGDPLPASFSD